MLALFRSLIRPQQVNAPALILIVVKWSSRLHLMSRACWFRKQTSAAPFGIPAAGVGFIRDRPGSGSFKAAVEPLVEPRKSDGQSRNKMKSPLPLMVKHVAPCMLSCRLHWAVTAGVSSVCSSVEQLYCAACRALQPAGKVICRYCSAPV